MTILLGSLFLLIAGSLQVTLVWRVSLLAGTPDLILLVLLAWLLQAKVGADWRWGLVAGLIVDLTSATPIWVSLLAYGAAAGLAQILNTRIWPIPVITLLAATVGGTLLIHTVELVYHWLNALPLNFADAFNLATLPSVMLNLLFVLPVSAIVSELSKSIAMDKDLP